MTLAEHGSLLSIAQLVQEILSGGCPVSPSESVSTITDVQLSRTYHELHMNRAAPLDGLILEHARVRKGKQQRSRLCLPLPVAAHELLHELRSKSTGWQPPRCPPSTLITESQWLDEERHTVAIRNEPA